MDKAKHYHNRAMSNQLEPESSPLRTMAINKFLNRELRYKNKDRLSFRGVKKYLPANELDRENEHKVY